MTRRSARRGAIGSLVAAMLVAASSACSSSGSDPSVTSGSFHPVADPVSSVDPFIGTGSGGSQVGDVSEFPGADVPFGMIQWSPDTPDPTPLQSLAGDYGYSEHVIRGFSLTHLSGAGCWAAGDFPVMPFAGPITVSPLVSPSTYETAFRHSDEEAHPGYYAVRLGNGVGVRLTVTQRTGIGEFSYPAGTQASMIVNPGGAETTASASQISVVGNDEIEGSATAPPICGEPGSYTVYFAAQFDRPFASFGVWQGGTLLGGTGSTDSSLGGAYVSFGGGTSGSPTDVEMKVSISYVSVADALGNLAAEQHGWDFSGVEEAATRQWNSLLGRVQVSGGTTRQKTVFYTALYHSLLFPSVFSDANGRYMGMDGKVHTTAGYPQYTNISEWDIYRSEVPLLALIAPRQMDGVVASMLNDYVQTGWLPRWPFDDVSTDIMGGDSADPIIAGAYAYGARGFDAPQALAAMVKGATQTGTDPGGYIERPGLAGYLQYGYVPDTSSAVQIGQETASALPNTASLTLEYGIDDFAISRFAAALGETKVAATFLTRSSGWKHLIDPATGWMAPALAGGSFPPGWPDGSRSESEALSSIQLGGIGQFGFQEGDQEQYTWLVPQDLAGLFQALGGREGATRRLEALFTHLNAGPTAPYDWDGNEPSIEIPWEGDYSGAPWLTQKVVSEILAENYPPTPGGEPGNDDLGAMSSWAVWAMLGLYPETPGTSVLVLGSPSFDAERLELPDGHAITVRATRTAASSIYVDHLSVDGRTSTRPWLPASAVRAGASLSVTLVSHPDKSWGSAPGDAPPSY